MNAKPVDLKLSVLKGPGKRADPPFPQRLCALSCALDYPLDCQFRTTRLNALRPSIIGGEDELPTHLFPSLKILSSVA